MRFYNARYPRYADDIEHNEYNPVRMHETRHLPGVICRDCLQWSSDDRLATTVPREVADRFSEVHFLDPEDWKAHSIQWARLLGVETSALTPGIELGAPRGLTTGLITQDIVHPFPGRLWINEKVRRVLETADLRGLMLNEVEIERGTEHPVPRLWEIVALGRGRTKRYAEEPPEDCPICGRDLRETPPLMDLDPAGWDGSDFIIVDENPNRLVVTHRVREVLEGIRASNIHFEEIVSQE
jgi:hypothetical protein